MPITGSFAINQARLSPIQRRRGFFGFNRTEVLRRLQNIRLDPARQRSLVQVLIQKGILKGGRVSQVKSLSDLTEQDLSLKITSQRLNLAIDQFNAFNEFGRVSIAASAIAPLERAGLGETISDTIWGIRDALIATAESLGSQSRFMQRNFGWNKSLIYNRSRNIQALRLLYIVSTNFAGLEEAQKIGQNWYEREVGGMPKEAREIYEGFLSTEGNFLGALRGGLTGLQELMQTEGFWAANPNAFSRQEGEFQNRLLQLVERVEADRQAEEIAAISVAERMQRQREMEGEIQGLLSAFEGLSGLDQNMREMAASLRLVAEFSVSVLECAPDADARRDAIGALIGATRNSVWQMRSLIAMKPKKRRALKYITMAAMALTTLYLTYRVYTTALALTGHLGAAFVSGGASLAITGMLLIGEIFFDALALVYMGNMVQAMNQADGSDGDAWCPRIRKGLDRDYKKRSHMAHMMVLVDEPTIAITPANASHVRSALWHGNADLLLADNSRYAYNKIGGESTIALGRKMVARAGILKRFVMHAIAPRLGEEEADIAAHFLSVSMGCGYTEADDEECQVFAFERTKEVLRSFRVLTKHVEVVGREIGRRVMAANKDTTRETANFLKNPLSASGITRMLVTRGIPLGKAVVMAQMIKDRIDTVVRRSRIAKTCNLVFQHGLDLNAAEHGAIKERFIQALREESGLTEQEANQLTDNIMAHREGINQAAASVVAERDFSANQSTREAFNTISRVAEELTRQDKRINSIDEGLGVRIFHIIQKALFMENRPIRARIPFASSRLTSSGPKIKLSLVKTCQAAADAVAERVERLPNLNEVRAGLMVEGRTFDKAEAEAWRMRELDIERIVLREVLAEGNEFGISAKEAGIVVRIMIEKFRENRQVRQQTSHQFAQQVFVAQIIQPNIPPEQQTPQAVATALVGGETGIMQEILLDDLPGLGIGRDHPIRAKVKAILGKFDPTAQRQELVDTLVRELEFHPAQASKLADEYASRHKAIIGRLTFAIEQIRDCSKGITPIAVVDGPNVRTVGGTVYFGAVAVDLTAIKAEAEKRVKKPDFAYPGWGAKGGTINAVLLGDCVPQNIGEIGRWVIHRLVGERFFPPRPTLSPQQAGDLPVARVAELNTYLAGTKMTEVSPELIAYIDQHMVGHHKYLVPATADPRLVEPDFVASYVVSRLTAEHPATPEQIRAELFDIWGIAGMSEADKALYGVTSKTQKELTDKVLYLTGEVQMRLAFARFVNIFTARPGCDVAAEVKTIGEAASLTKEQIAVVTKRANQAKQVHENGLVAFAGSGKNCFMRITTAADRTARVDRLLFDHYTETLGQYSDLTENHESGMAAEREAGTVALDALEKILFGAENIRKLRSVTAVVNDKEQFAAKALELAVSGKSREEAREALLDALGIRYPISANGLRQAEQAVNAAQAEVAKRFGVFFEPLMGRILGGFVNDPTQDFAPQIDAALAGADYLAPEEKTAFRAQAVAFATMLQDIRVKAHEEQAMSFHLEHSPSGSRRLRLAFNEKVATTRQYHNAHETLEQLQYYSIAVAPSTGSQVAEDVIIKSRIPLVTINRESFGLEVRQVGVAVDAHFAAIQPLLETEAARLEAEDLTRDERIRQLTVFATAKLAERVTQTGALPGKQNYFSETGTDKDGNTIPLKADGSTLDYAGYHVDDADYRVNLTCLTDLAPYVDEHPGYVHFGNRQFGRNYRENAVANGFQSGGNAFWSWTNEANSLKGLTPSWGAQMIYSSRAYRNGSHFINNSYYKGTIGDKFLLNDTWKNFEQWAGTRILTARPAVALPASILFQAFNTVMNPATSLADAGIAIVYHGFKDFRHFLIMRGLLAKSNREEKLGVLGKAIDRFLDKAIDREQVIGAKVQSMLAAQDATTESEDIASDIWFLRMATFMMDESKSKWGEFFKWFSPKFINAQFSVTGTRHVAKGMFSSAWVPGIAGLGAHSEDKRGKDVTFDGRWLRGNLALTFSLLTAKYGIWRKTCFLSLSGFWAKGIFKPFLLIPPLAFLFNGAAGLAMMPDPDFVLKILSLAFGAFTMNMGVFLASLSAKGYFNRGGRKEGLGCLLMDWTGTQSQLKAAWQGLVMRARPGFQASPKESIAPAKAWKGALAADYAFMAANIAGMGVAADFMISGGSGLTATLFFWCGFHAFHQAVALWNFNKGIFLANPAVGAKPGNVSEAITKGLPEYFGRYYPKHKTSREATALPFAYSSEDGEKEPVKMAASV